MTTCLSMLTIAWACACLSPPCSPLTTQSLGPPGPNLTHLPSEPAARWGRWRGWPDLWGRGDPGQASWQVLTEYQMHRGPRRANLVWLQEAPTAPRRQPRAWAGPGWVPSAGSCGLWGSGYTARDGPTKHRPTGNDRPASRTEPEAWNRTQSHEAACLPALSPGPGQACGHVSWGPPPPPRLQCRGAGSRGMPGGNLCLSLAPGPLAPLRT